MSDGRSWKPGAPAISRSTLLASLSEASSETRSTSMASSMQRRSEKAGLSSSRVSPPGKSSSTRCLMSHFQNFSAASAASAEGCSVAGLTRNVDVPKLARTTMRPVSPQPYMIGIQSPLMPCQATPSELPLWVNMRVPSCELQNMPTTSPEWMGGP